MSGLYRRILIVGGGIAGVSTCSYLRDDGYDGEILLFDAGDFPYDRPPLSKKLLAGLKEGNDLALQPAEWYERRGVELVRRAEVHSIDPDNLLLRTSDGVVRGDAVVLATGGRASRPPIAGADDPRVHVLRNLDDAQALREAVGAGTRVLVIGAGLIGAEVASTLVALGSTVTMVDPVALPLSGVVGAEVARWMHGLHASHGIDVRHAGVERIESGAIGMTAHLTDGSEAVVADIIVLSVGMVPADELARAAGIEVDRGVLVDGHQESSRTGIFAVGDVSRRRGADGKPLPRAEHWEAAQHDAARFAAHVLGRELPADRAPWFWSDRHGRHIEVVGNLSSGELIWRGSPQDGAFSVFAVCDGRVVGAMSADDTRVVRAARRLIDGQMTVDLSALADVTIDPRKLVKR